MQCTSCYSLTEGSIGMNTNAPSVVTSGTPNPDKRLKNILKDSAKVALCASPMLALLAFSIYCLLIDT